jgi:hypothetical protein
MKMTLDEAMREIRTKPVVPLWPVVGMALSLSRGSTYAAAARGEIDVIVVGRLKKAITAPLRRKLGLEPAGVAAA